MQVLQPMPFALGSRLPFTGRVRKCESEDRNDDASFGTATMRVFKILAGTQN
jgi:hypothetical protein